MSVEIFKGSVLIFSVGHCYIPSLVEMLVLGLAPVQAFLKSLDCSSKVGALFDLSSCLDRLIWNDYAGESFAFVAAGVQVRFEVVFNQVLISEVQEVFDAPGVDVNKHR